jgi:hypothetical protein
LKTYLLPSLPYHQKKSSQRKKTEEKKTTFSYLLFFSDATTFLYLTKNIQLFSEFLFKMMINKVCNICGDVSGRQVTCNGCEQSFCWTHMTDHQQSIEKQMDSLSEKSHLLQQNSNDDSYYNHLFHQIDQWEKESIDKIQLEANTNRDQLKLIIQQSKDIFERSIKQISEEIDHNRQLNNFSEIEIKQFTQQLTDIQSQIQTSFDIQIKEDEQTLPITFIKVKQNTKRPFDQNEQTVKRSRNEANNHVSILMEKNRSQYEGETPYSKK